MRKAIALFVLLGLVLSMGAVSAKSASDCVEVKRSEFLESRHTFDISRAMIKNAQMEGVIEAAEENGADASSLESIRDEVNSKFDNISTETRAMYGATMGEIRGLLQQFRETARAMGELEGKESEVRAKIAENVEGVQAEADSIKGDAKGKAKEISLGLFDFHVCIAEVRIGTLSDRGLDTAEATAALDEVTAKRPVLEAALETEDRAEIEEANNEVKGLWKELRTAFANAVKKKAQEYEEKVMGRAQEAIDGLRGAGVDTTALEESCNEIEEKFSEIDALAEEGDRAGALAARQELRTLLQKTAQEIKETFWGVNGGKGGASE